MNNTLKAFVIIFSVIGLVCCIAIAKDGVKLQKWKAKYKMRKYSEISRYKEDNEDPYDEISQHNKR